MKWVVQHRARTGDDWSEPKFFATRGAAKATLRKIMAEARPETEGLLVKGGMA
jgi:hypothetical protein